MVYDVSQTAAYAVLYSVLSLFTILALGAGGFLPKAVSSWCILSNSISTTTKDAATDHFLSARNSASSFAVAISFFASGMGAWVCTITPVRWILSHLFLFEHPQRHPFLQVLYGSTEMGATPALSWIAVLGYALGSSLPAVLIGCFLGPPIREMTKGQGAFSTSDFARKRYGRIMQLVVVCISGFYMFIYMVAELTSISTVFKTLTNSFDDRAFGILVTISLGAFTVFYTTIAGLPASIVTDKFQGLIMVALVVMLAIAVTTQPENKVSAEEFALASAWTIEGFQALVTLILAIASAELFNQGTWQRVWAAESVPAMRKGFTLGALMVFLLMMFFGIMGMIGYANDPEAYDAFEKFNFLAFFDVLAPLHPFWHIVTLILVTALASSSVDTLQNALTSVFSHDLIKIGWNPAVIARVVIVLVNIPAVYLASKGYSVLELFLVADLVCATSVFPLFLGLQTKDYGMLMAPTELGAFLGVLSGFAAVLVNGVINEAEGGLFEYFWLRNGGICALCGVKTMVSFIVTPLVSLVMTYFFSYLSVALLGDRARRPVFTFGFDSGTPGNDGEDEFAKTEGGEDLKEGPVVDEVLKEPKTTANASFAYIEEATA